MRFMKGNNIYVFLIEGMEIKARKLIMFGDLHMIIQHFHFNSSTIPPSKAAITKSIRKKMFLENINQSHSPLYQ